MTGTLALVIVAHVPYVRSIGREPAGEDRLHRLLAGGLIPVLRFLADMRERGTPTPVTFAIAPILLEQLADPIIQKHIVYWLERQIDTHEAAARDPVNSDDQQSYVREFAIEWTRGLLETFDRRFSRNLVAVIRDLCRYNGASALASAATHAYLPLAASATTVRAQIEIGTLATTRQLDLHPQGFWLPEMGYTPAIERALQLAGLRYTIADPATLVTPGVPTLRPRWTPDRKLAMFFRDVELGEQVHSHALGYPGDPLYRAESDAARARGGTGYDPYHAFRRANEHGAHFVAALAASLGRFAQRHDRPGIAVVPVDLALVGGQWFEGPIWLSAIVEQLATAEAPAALTTLDSYLTRYRPRQVATLRAASWGPGGDHHLWEEPRALVLRRAIAAAEQRLDHIVRRFPDATGDQERVLAQALREVLLAQSSTWQEQDADPQRAYTHLGRFDRLYEAAELRAAGDVRALLDDLEERDNPFATLNYRSFAA